MKLSSCAANQLVACFDYQATEPHELTVSRGERLQLLDSSREWWLVQNENSQSGYVPSNYVKRVKHNFITSIRSAFREVLHRNESDEYSQLRVTIPGRSASQQLTATRSDSDLNRGMRSNTVYLANRGDITINFQSDCAVPVSNNSADTRDCNPYVARPYGTGSTVLAGRFALVLYTYEAQKSDELTLRRGDRVCVQQTCADGWWHVQHVGELTQSSKSKLPIVINGWFPSNYLLLDSSESLSLDHRTKCEGDELCKSSRPAIVPIQELRRYIGDKEWYWASVRRVECERALAKAIGGSFLVRDCESSPGDLTIVVRRFDLDTQSPSQSAVNISLCRNFCVRFVKPNFAIGSLKFESVDALIEHYKRHPIFNADNEKLFLGQSLQRDRKVNRMSINKSIVDD